MHSSRRVLKSLAIWTLIAVSGVGAARAQTDHGAVCGAIRDAHGVMPGAQVVLINEETNGTESAMSNEVGEYAFADVRPGTYTIRVSLPGFKAEERKRLRVGMRQSRVHDFVLEFRGVTEQIVDAGSSLVEPTTETRAVGSP